MSKSKKRLQKEVKKGLFAQAAEGADGSEFIVDEEAVKQEVYRQVARCEVCSVVWPSLHSWVVANVCYWPDRATVSRTMFLQRSAS